MSDEANASPARAVERVVWPAFALVGAVLLGAAGITPFAEAEGPQEIVLRTIDFRLAPAVVAVQSVPTVAAILVVASAAIRLAVDARPGPLALGLLLGVGMLAFSVQVARLLELSMDDFLIPALGAFLGPAGSGLILIGGVLELPRHLERPAAGT